MISTDYPEAPKNHESTTPLQSFAKHTRRAHLIPEGPR